MFLDEFFRVCNDTQLPDGRTVHVRTLSDAEIQSRGEYVISEQLKIQDSLRDTASELYRLKVEPLLSATDEEIIDSLAEIRRGDLIIEASEQVPLDFYPYPDDATDEERLNTERRQREHEETVYAARARYIIENDRLYREKLAKLSSESLHSSIKSAAMRIYVLRAQVDAEAHFTIMRSYNTSDGKPLWTIEQVKNFPGSVINRLMTEYRKVDSVDPWELTKSLTPGSSGGVESGDQERGADK